MSRVAIAKTFVKKISAAWSIDKPSRLAAALAYYSMFSAAPALFIALTVAGIFLDELAMADQLFGRLGEILGPEAVQFLEELVVNIRLERASGGGSLLTSLISLGALLYAATGVFAQLQYALNTIWNVPPPEKGGIVPFLRTRLIAFVMVVGVGFLFVLLSLASIVVSVLTSIFQWGTLVPFLNFAAFAGLATLLFALLYKVLPATKIAWRDVWLGAVIAALIFAIGRLVLGLYFSRSNVSSAFEAAGALAILLIAVYYGAQIFLLGALFTKVYAENHGSRAGQQGVTENNAGTATNTNI